MITKERAIHGVTTVALIIALVVVITRCSALHEQLVEWRLQRERANADVLAMTTREGMVIRNVEHCAILNAFDDDEKRGLVFRGVPGPAVKPLDAKCPERVIHVLNTGYAGRIVPTIPIRRGQVLSLILLAIREELPTPSMPIDVDLMRGSASEWRMVKIVMPTGTLAVWLTKAGNDKPGYIVHYSFNMLSGPYRDLTTYLWDDFERVVDGIESVEQNTSEKQAGVN
jgi:hypothetical protein